jgi:hypothetical protein
VTLSDDRSQDCNLSFLSVSICCTGTCTAIQLRHRVSFDALTFHRLYGAASFSAFLHSMFTLCLPLPDLPLILTVPNFCDLIPFISLIRSSLTRLQPFFSLGIYSRRGDTGCHTAAPSGECERIGYSPTVPLQYVQFISPCAPIVIAVSPTFRQLLNQCTDCHFRYH